MLNCVLASFAAMLLHGQPHNEALQRSAPQPCDLSNSAGYFDISVLLKLCSRIHM